GAWVSGNSVERCRIGVEINDANECWVSRNRFEDCEIGVNIWRWCKQPNLNERNMILHNLIFNSKKTAVYLSDGTAHNTVEGNWIRGFGERGILDEGANQRMVGNTVIEGGEEGKPR
ncbi:MAG: right-handed parallel beta-helix repeat-containing protein, partial [Spirochaetia bacterium]|nr:right-handed parallel beta-helix repeat-containing protein [Spirochaetia bacterium]